MDAEHEVMAGALEVAREEMNGLVRDPSRPRADAAREAMGDLRVATVTHLDHEERELEAFYVENADHPEVKAMEGEFRKRARPFGGQFFAWVTDGHHPGARAAFKGPGAGVRRAHRRLRPRLPAARSPPSGAERARLAADRERRAVGRCGHRHR